LIRKKQDAELTLGQMRTTFKKANEEFKERQLRLTEERKSLHELDTLIHELKGTVCTIL
jgi:ribonuclease I